jgi:hypothetical protein
MTAQKLLQAGRECAAPEMRCVLECGGYCREAECIGGRRYLVCFRRLVLALKHSAFAGRFRCFLSYEAVIAAAQNVTRLFLQMGHSCLLTARLAINYKG